VNARLARWATALAVLAVAVIAAVVSFTHIESLALANGYSIDTARLLPFSVDGLIIASSLSLATDDRVALARTGLVLGVAANIMFGVRFGVTGAVVNSWPAVSFIIASEILVGMLRARPATVPQDVPQDVTSEAPVDAPEIVVEAVPASTVPPTRERHVRTVAPRGSTRGASWSRPGCLLPNSRPVNSRACGPSRRSATWARPGHGTSLRSWPPRSTRPRPRKTETRKEVQGVQLQGPGPAQGPAGGLR
jgi:hypothetical protein